MFDLIRYTVGVVFFFGVCGVALWRGNWPERVAAIAILVGSLLTPMVQVNRGENGPEVWVFLIDLTVTAILVVIALRSDRWWALFGAAYSALIAFTHVARSLGGGVGQYTFLSSTVLWSYFLIFALAGGLWELELRRRRARSS